MSITDVLPAEAGLLITAVTIAAGRDVAQLVEEQEVESAEFVAEAEQLPVLVGLAEGGDQSGHTPEPDPLPLGAGGQAQRRGQVSLAGARGPDEQDVLPLGQVIAA